MTKLIDLFLGKRTAQPCERYANAQGLFEGLEREEPDAIRCLYSKVAGVIYRIGKEAKLADEDIEELIGDCITIGLQKIRSGKFVFQGYAPTTFIIEIAKNRAQNFRRNQIRHQTEELKSGFDAVEEEAEMHTMEAADMMEQLLLKLDPNCRKLIHLKYFEERKDKDVIAEKNTQYTTVDALKNHRSRCLKKLMELARAVLPKSD